MLVNNLNIKKSSIIFILAVALFSVASLLTVSTSNAAMPLYVNGSGDDTWDGTSPTWIENTIGPMKTIQIAINNVDEGGTINVASGTYNEHLSINKNLNLVGEDPETTIIDGTNSGQVINVAALSNVNISNFTLKNGTSTEGGGIYSLATLNINNCIITGNNASNGGGIFAAGTTTVNNSVISGNTADYGGGITYGWNTLTVRYSKLNDNAANYAGNEIYCGPSTVNAQYNWWGQNTGPQEGQIYGTVSYSPWIYMTLTPSSTSIIKGGNSQLTASFNNAYDGTTVTSFNPASGHIPNGLNVTFASDSAGIVNPTTGKTLNGSATTNYVAGGNPGISIVNATLDDETVEKSVTITNMDLISSSVTAPATGFRGSTITVANTVMNQGTTAVAGFYVTYYLCSAQSLGGTIYNVGCRYVSGLAAGASSSASSVLNVPGTVPVGLYYVAAFVDSTRLIAEVNESNNAGFSASRMNVLDGCDLVVTGVTAPVTGIRGNQITVPNTVKNVGNAAVAGFYVTYYLCSAQSLGGTIYNVGCRYVSGLAAGASSSASSVLNVPGTVPVGLYYVAAFVDSTRLIAEVNESNNAGFSASRMNVLDGCDLVVTGVTAPVTGIRGNQITVPNTVKNVGNAAVAGFYVTYYLCSAQSLGGTIYNVGCRYVSGLAAGASSSASSVLNVPGTVPVGLYYVAAFVDSTRLIAEVNESNNAGFSASRMNVLDGCDLVVTGVTAPVTGIRGNQITVPNTVKNVGNAAVAGFYVTYYLCSAQSLGGTIYNVGCRYVSGLAAGASSSASSVLNVPGTVPVGLYYVAAFVDSTRLIAEVNESNNAGFSASKLNVMDLVIDPTPPSSPVKITFIHHSCGGNWLADGNGNLGAALNANNYYVTETDYGWDAESGDNLGDYTNTNDWPSWFNDVKMPYVYANDQHSAYTNTISNPGGENEIIMFKSCFPLSEVGSSIDDEKAIYNSLKAYFAAHPNKLFVLITPPGETNVESYQLTRELCNWLVDKDNGWLAGYSGKNVMVYDFYGVLSEVNSHHRYTSGNIEHVYAADYDGNSPYHNGDDHPNAIGNQKATNEFLPLLNIAYNQWKS
nr:CARDB domain-containing protein [uncultured Methanobacterium sp.]